MNQDMILIIEDDSAIAAIEQDYLEFNGFKADIASTGPEGLDMALKGTYNLILLDVMLPGMDGFQICKKLRETMDIPILMVTARREDVDQIRGLGLGADDYIEKPFSPSVLIAKVRSQLTRYKRLKGDTEESSGIIEWGAITLNSKTHQVFVNGDERKLKNKEFQLLEFLMLNPNAVFSREHLYTKIWGLDAIGDTATVAVHVNRLREIIEEDSTNPQYILTVWGAGYKFKAPEEGE